MAVYGGVKVNCRLEGAWQISGEMSIALIESSCLRYYSIR